MKKKPSIRSINRALVVACSGAALALGVSACSSDPQLSESELDDSVDPTELAEQDVAPDEPRVNGNLIESVTLSDEHTLEFWQLDNGAAFAYESMPIDSEEPAILDFAEGETASLADIYRMALPDVVEVPATILDADARAALAQDGTPSEAQLRVAMEESPAVLGYEPTVEVEQMDPGVGQARQAAEVSCSADYYGDNWGAQWFLNNYCTQGEFRRCYTNLHFFMAEGLAGECVTGTWFHFTEMNGDFYNHVLSMRGSHWSRSKGRFIADFDFPVQPRYIGRIAYRFNGMMCLAGDRFQSCDTHSHFAIGYND